MEIKVITTLYEFKEIIPAWNELLEQDSQATIFQTPAWILTCYECFESKDELNIITVYEGQQLIGIAPLLIKNKKVYGLKRRVLTFIGAENYASDYCRFIILQQRLDIIAKIFSEIMQHPCWQILDLPSLPSDSPEVSYLETEHVFPKFISFKQIEAPAFILSSPEVAQTLINHTSLKRHTKNFQKKGSLEILHLNQAEEITPWLEPFFAQHIARWNKLSLFLQDSQRLFYTLATKRLAQIKALIFTVVLFNKKPLAFHFGFNYHDVFYWYKPSFDIAFKQQSPGEVLQQSLYTYAITNDLKKFDFTIGDEPFKYRFANQINFNKRLIIYSHYVDYALHQLHMQLSKIKKLLANLIHYKF